MLISVLNKYGIKTIGNITLAAAAGSRKELETLGYEAGPEEVLNSLESTYYGTKLEGTVLCYSAGPDKKSLVDMGYVVTCDKSEIINYGVYLWKKKYAKQKLIKDIV